MNEKNRHSPHSQTGVSLPADIIKSKKRYNSIKFLSKIKPYGGQRQFLSGSGTNNVDII